MEGRGPASAAPAPAVLLGLNTEAGARCSPLRSATPRKAPQPHSLRPLAAADAVSFPRTPSSPSPVPVREPVVVSQGSWVPTLSPIPIHHPPHSCPGPLGEGTEKATGAPGPLCSQPPCRPAPGDRRDVLTCPVKPHHPFPSTLRCCLFPPTAHAVGSLHASARTHTVRDA